MLIRSSKAEQVRLPLPVYQPQFAVKLNDKKQTSDGLVQFWTIRQHLLDKRMLVSTDTFLEQASLVCAWHEPFVLHYERPPSKPSGASPYKQMAARDSENRFFSVELFLPEVRRDKTGEHYIDHQIGKTLSF